MAPRWIWGRTIPRRGHVVIRHGDVILRADRVRTTRPKPTPKRKATWRWSGPGSGRRPRQLSFSRTIGIHGTGSGRHQEPFFLRRGALNAPTGNATCSTTGIHHLRSTGAQLVPSCARPTAAQRLSHHHPFVMKVRNVPLFYTPFMMWPVKEGRATDFCCPPSAIPQTGRFDQQRVLPGAVGWMGRHHLSGLLQPGRPGSGQEVRYHPESVKGILQAIDPPEVRRCGSLARHFRAPETSRRLGAHGAHPAFVRHLFPRDYRRDFNTGSLSQVASSILLTKTAD